MIGSLRGTVLDRRARPDGTGEVVVEAAGVGYRVVVPAATLGALGGLGSAAFVHVHTHVREEALILYGFATLAERDCFEALIGARGVGPAVALAMLSVHSPAALRLAVDAHDADALTLVPGIGRKTAARLLIDLASRLGDGDDFAGPGAGVTANGAAGDARSEVRAALGALGYDPDEVRAALARLPGEGDVEDLMRVALRDLAPR
ncbi:MAG: Holliday junction branch migration protein RuvA [Acidimicrobiales bacterium]